MKPVKLTLIITCMIIFISCTKKTEKKVPPPPEPAWTPYTIPPQPEFKLTRLTERRPRSNGTPDISTTVFTYDNKNRLTVARSLEDDRILAEYRYIGEELIQEVVYNDDGSTSEYDSCVRFSTNADTITFMYVHDFDVSYRYQFIFRDSVVTKLERYYMRDDVWTLGSQHVWAYSPSNNLQQLTQFAEVQPPIVRCRVLATDNQKNPLRHLSFLLLRVIDFEGTFYSGMGINNATRVEVASGQTSDIQYTYNNEGYPLTMTFPTGRTIEFEYRR